MDRDVAIKIPRKDQLSPEEAEQFLREARAAAQLRHPHIVAVHEVGRDGSTIYIVSDFIPGMTLAEKIARNRIAPEEAARLCMAISEALHHAHEAGVVHRDLKPSNILLDSRESPLVTDFGLAKRDVGEVAVTLDGRILGTPAYMAPEQARGKSRNADRRADVYALGVILYEILTGRRPFEGTVPEMIHQVIHVDPPAPRKLRISVPLDLETICLKCLEKDRECRYAAASEIADELRRYLAGEPINARPIGSLHRLGRRIRRNPVAAVSVTGIVLLTLLLLMMPRRPETESSGAPSMDSGTRLLHERLGALKDTAQILGFDSLAGRTQDVIDELSGITTLDYEEQERALQARQSEYENLRAEVRPEIDRRAFELGLVASNYVTELTRYQVDYADRNAWLQQMHVAEFVEQNLVARCTEFGFTPDTSSFWESPESRHSWSELIALLTATVQQPLETHVGIEGGRMFSFGLNLSLVTLWLQEYSRGDQTIVRVRDPGEFSVRTREVIDSARTAEVPLETIEILQSALEQFAAELAQDDTDYREAASRLRGQYVVVLRLMESQFKAATGTDPPSLP